MATMHNSKDELRTKYEKLKRRRLLPGRIVYAALIIASFVALYYVPLKLRGIFYGARFVAYPLLVCVICSSIYKLRTGEYGRKTEEEETLELAVTGEEKVLSVLSSLPDWCHVYTNVTIPWKDRQGKKKSSHVDIILVSPCRIVAIKIKNLKGTVCGTVSDQNLTQKTYRHGTIFREKTFYNPVKQVQTHAYALSSYLKEHGLQHYVYTGVFFSNDDAELDIRGETDIHADCPIFEASDAGRFYTYFRAHHYRLLDDEEVQKVLLVLDELVENPVG